MKRYTRQQLGDLIIDVVRRAWPSAPDPRATDPRATEGPTALNPLHNLVRLSLAGSEQLAADLEGVLRKYGFAATYIEPLVQELVEAYINDDPTPIWCRPDYRPPGVGD